MSFIKSLFVIISKFYRKKFPKYRFWSAHTEFIIALLLDINVLSIVLLLNVDLKKSYLIAIVVIIHLLVAFGCNNMDDVDFIENYNLSKASLLISRLYIIGSVLFFIGTIASFFVLR